MSDLDVRYPDGMIKAIDIHKPPFRGLTNCLRYSDPFVTLHFGDKTEIHLYVDPGEAAKLNKQLTDALATQEAETHP